MANKMQKKTPQTKKTTKGRSTSWWSWSGGMQGGKAGVWEALKGFITKRPNKKYDSKIKKKIPKKVPRNHETKY